MAQDFTPGKDLTSSSAALPLDSGGSLTLQVQKLMREFHKKKDNIIRNLHDVAAAGVQRD